MKEIVFFVITFISNAYAQQSRNYLNNIDNIASAESKAYARVSASKDASSASQNFDIKYYRCEWKVDPAVRYITGKVTSYFIITSAADYISFDLMDTLAVDSVIQKNNLLSFKHLNNTLTNKFCINHTGRHIRFGNHILPGRTTQYRFWIIYNKRTCRYARNVDIK